MFCSAMLQTRAMLFLPASEPVVAPAEKFGQIATRLQVRTVV